MLRDAVCNLGCLGGRVGRVGYADRYENWEGYGL